MTFEVLLQQARINYGNLSKVEWFDVPEAKLEEALARLLPTPTSPAEAVEVTKVSVRDLWKVANRVGNPYALVDFTLSPFAKFAKKYKTFEGWFDYFYAECNDAKRQEIYRECLNPDGTFKGDFASSGPAVRDPARKALLRRMLDAGFVAYGTDYFGTSDDLLKPVFKHPPSRCSRSASAANSARRRRSSCTTAAAPKRWWTPSGRRWA